MFYTDSPFYTDTRYNVKIRYNDKFTVTKPSLKSISKSQIMQEYCI